MSLFDDLRGLNRKVGGAHLTIQARDGHLREFAQWCKDRNFQIQRADQIKEKHIRGFMESLISSNTERTRQNKLSALRVIIRETGKTKFADGIGTRDMGVQQASRDGTKRGLSENEYAEILNKVNEFDRGCALAVELCRELGLRRQEVLMADARTLRRWAERIEAGQKIDVIRGTKGGRYRETTPANKELALDAIRRAYDFASQGKGQGFLVPAGGLRESLKRFTNVCSRAGMNGEKSPHSLRYTYAIDRLGQLREQGYSRRDAASIVSQDLGHGDGRIDYVLQVYAKT